jgi:hypothetical protein
MRRLLIVSLAVALAFLIGGIAYSLKGATEKGATEHQPLLIWSVPDENLENFMAEALQQGLLRGVGGYPNPAKLKELIENFGGWWREIENSDSLAASGVEDRESTGLSKTSFSPRTSWSVPPENQEAFNEEMRRRGLIVEHSDGAVERRIQGRENEFKELVENFGGKWVGDVKPFPSGKLITDERELGEMRSKVENLREMARGGKLDNVKSTLASSIESREVAPLAVYSLAQSGMKTTYYDYRGYHCLINIPAEVDPKPWNEHFNLWNIHLVQSFDPYKGIETGVGWVANWQGLTPGLYIYCAVDGEWVAYKSIPTGASRDIWPYVETRGSSEGAMYIDDLLYSGKSLYYVTTVTALNSVAGVQQEIYTNDHPNWIDTSHHHTKIYWNVLKDKGNNWIYWDSAIPTEYFNWLPLKMEQGYESPSYYIWVWSQFQTDIALETLYRVKLVCDLRLQGGTKLWLQFLSYDNVDRGKTTVWTGTTPCWVNFSTPVSRLDPIQKVWLCTDVGHYDTLLKEFVVHQSDLRNRIMNILRAWSSYPELQNAFRAEIQDILRQWSSAPG